jgi:predicted amidohydrolase
VPAGCDSRAARGCGPALSRLADQATAAHVGLYFVGAGAAISQLAGLTARFGGGTAEAVYDTDGVLAAAYHPVGLTVLLVYSDATADVRRNLPPDFQFTPVLRQLNQPGKQSAR